MSKSRISDYKAYRGLTKTLLTVGGLWPYSNSNIFYRFLPYIQIILNLGMALAILGFVHDHFSNIALVTRGMSVMTSFLTTILKVTCLVINKKDLMELHENLDPYLNDLLKNSPSTEVILKDINSFKFLSWGLTFFAFIAMCFLIFTPLLFILHCHQHEIELINYPLIYPSVYPWKIISNGWIYKLNYIFETLASLILFFVTASVDSLFTLYVFQMVGLLREISYCITRLDEKNVDKDSVICKCITQYEKLMRCREILEKIYGPVILWIMTTNAVVLCTLLFQISQMKSISVTRGLLFTTYITLKMIQTFMYAWSGSCLTDESENYKDAVYAAHWYGNKRFMTSVIIMLAQRPLTLTACNFSTVSLKIFVMVLNTTVSYFFLLQTLDYQE
ncbi:odorant receptor 13a-like [Microplitis demolitor]|uniref:odorant receptor 13a-like n=1 Tax=Microplitis demolitor TaxID=69319 RepID=UPI00235B5B41|nr:odorant receptor 13a-like [Microplitis demolitor]